MKKLNSFILFFTCAVFCANLAYTQTFPPESYTNLDSSNYIIRDKVKKSVLLLKKSEVSNNRERMAHFKEEYTNIEKSFNAFSHELDNRSIPATDEYYTTKLDSLMNKSDRYNDEIQIALGKEPEAEGAGRILEIYYTYKQVNKNDKSGRKFYHAFKWDGWDSIGKAK